MQSMQHLSMMQIEVNGKGMHKKEKQYALDHNQQHHTSSWCASQHPGLEHVMDEKCKFAVLYKAAVLTPCNIWKYHQIAVLSSHIDQ